MSDIPILTKSFDHDAKDIWLACGLDHEKMQGCLNQWKDELNANRQPSRMIELIESKDLTEREKLTLGYYICGMLGAQHFERVMQDMTALTQKQLSIYKEEIIRLGGNPNPSKFGETKPKVVQRRRKR